jgi:DNA polymerase III sliding clamp (beta) subunit (PCNA family)
MKFQASELKHAFKKLTPVKTDFYRFDGDTVVAQDSEVTVVVPAPRFEKPFTIQAKKLSAVTNRMSGDIEATQGERSLVLKSAKARVELEAQIVKSVALPLQQEKFITLNLPEFKKNLAVAVASASTAKSASFGGSVQIQSLPIGLEETTPGGYRIVGTDSIVLTVAEIKNQVPFEFKWLLNLTAASVVQLMDGETVNIGESNTHLQIFGKDCSIYSSKPVQAYPNFDVLLVKQPHTKVKLNPQEWLSALRTIEPLIDEEKDKGAISLTFKENVVEWLNIGVGNTASDESSYEQLEPDPFFEPKEFGLNITAKYLSGFLSKAGDDATLGITDRPVRLESGNVVVLTMPAPGAAK